jgi:hypothetical protein
MMALKSRKSGRKRDKKYYNSICLILDLYLITLYNLSLCSIFYNEDCY